MNTHQIAIVSITAALAAVVSLIALNAYQKWINRRMRKELEEAASLDEFERKHIALYSRVMLGNKTAQVDFTTTTTFRPEFSSYGSGWNAQLLAAQQRIYADSLKNEISTRDAAATSTTRGSDWIRFGDRLPLPGDIIEIRYDTSGKIIPCGRLEQIRDVADVRPDHTVIVSSAGPRPERLWTLIGEHITNGVVRPGYEWRIQEITRKALPPYNQPQPPQNRMND